MFEVEKEHSQFDFTKEKTQVRSSEELKEIFKDFDKIDESVQFQSNGLINLILYLGFLAVGLVFFAMYFLGKSL